MTPQEIVEHHEMAKEIQRLDQENHTLWEELKDQRKEITAIKQQLNYLARRSRGRQLVGA